MGKGGRAARGPTATGARRSPRRSAAQAVALARKVLRRRRNRTWLLSVSPHRLVGGSAAVVDTAAVHRRLLELRRVVAAIAVDTVAQHARGEQDDRTEKEHRLRDEHHGWGRCVEDLVFRVLKIHYAGNDVENATDDSDDGVQKAIHYVDAIFSGQAEGAHEDNENEAEAAPEVRNHELADDQCHEESDHAHEDGPHSYCILSRHHLH